MKENVEAFIERWKDSGGSERANFQRFAAELTQILGVDAPKVATSDHQNDDYRFERPVTFVHTGTNSRGYIDLYRKGCFILEAKQGAEVAVSDPSQLRSLVDNTQKVSRQGHGIRGSRKWDDTMLKARNQADGYARAVAREDGWPPFLLIVDIGHVIEVYADFSGQGQGYTQYPDKNRYRIHIDDLHDPDVRDRLKTIWEDPKSLDPALISAKVTREIADHLAQLGVSLRNQGHDNEVVARFLMRCLFSMFAEDVELIDQGSFTELLMRLKSHPEHAAPALQGLWETMNTGGFSQVLMKDLKRFNGGLFADATALPLDDAQLSLLIEAAEADWRQVEPAIFGTLLERALDAKQRHKLGAHYTPRSYVERLVTPTIMEPLREDWKDVQTAVQRLMSDGKEKAARKLVHEFHRKLCEMRVLDPACGSGNFLYVSMELMKRLEGEVTALLEELGEDQTSLGLSGMTVDPHQFLGIELNPWAAAVAELVLWIGYLQWHFRTYGKAAPSEPVLRDFKNIENRDAVLDWDERKPRMDDDGQPVTRWDGMTTMRHPVTGDEVPDPSFRVQLYDYERASAAEWPEAEFIVGNPPFIGNKRMREALGDGYVEALWQAYPKVPQSADLVMFWWEKAALKARNWKRQRATGTRRFGLITTNSLRQTFNRRVLEPHLSDPKKPLSLVFAIPDHPWVDSGKGDADVRISMTVAAAGNRSGQLSTVVTEGKEQSEAEGRKVTFERKTGKLFANLQIGANVAGATALEANSRIAYQGVIPGGDGFYLTPEEATTKFSNEKNLGLVRRYLNGREFVHFKQPRYIIDFTGLDKEKAMSLSPALYQRVLDTVKPIRDNVTRRSRRERWWIYSEPNVTMRPMFKGLARYIATCRTAKHRVFGFLDSDILPDAKLIAIGSDDAGYLAVLSSRFHVIWAIAAGGWLGVGNDANYNHAQCFNVFPFPELSDAQRTHLRALGEELDEHRKRQQRQHPKLTLTKMYNVLEMLRAGKVINGEDREIYDQSLIAVLRDIHDRIDVAVADAYGWPVDLLDEEVLMRLVDLNKERVAEEAAGCIRWLRPEYQNPEGRISETKGSQTEMAIGAAQSAAKTAWPKSLPDQIAAVRAALEASGEATPEQIARKFSRARTSTVQPLLESLAALGQAVQTDRGTYSI
ncbi:class I SAM-dependent DNA methyltransferase [Ruegeria sp. HKCCA5426]|uniref:class I SAM-dependent DNA methyltransferase n=1 Tax=Ruegeria sp. HKCCA5426 TaxID=2682985 RepID=UPI001487C89C|nr:class I SAM-dependent DNA methyltransferase [Ruegeria sp. HKCCA5426]